MQLNLVNFLMGSPAPAAATGGEGGSGGNFAQLLGGMGGGTGNPQGGGKGLLSGGEMAAVALIAQELDPEQLAALQGIQGDKLSQLLSDTIGPDEAQALLARLEAMQEQTGGEFNDPAFDQLQYELEQVVESGEPTDVASLLESLPEVAEAETPAERAPVLQRLMGWMQAAMEKHKEASALAAAVPDSTAQSLQASLFPAGHDAVGRSAAPADSTPTEERIEPAQAAPVTEVIVPTAQTHYSAMPVWVQKLGTGDENIVPTEIDEAIPSLALAPEEEGLPVVDLPGGEDEELAEVLSFTKPAPLKKDGTEPRAAMETFAVAPAPVDMADAAPQQTVPVDADGLAIAPATGTNTVSAHGNLNPITLNTHTQLVPHQAASEQVHVAVTNMKKDGLDRITLQLEPADLGRIEIKMDINTDGRANLSFVVDKPETLDSLSRDARSLERALQEAGVRADAGSMEFNLRQQKQEDFAEGFEGSGNRAAETSDDDEQAALSVPTKHYTINVREGVDIQA